MVTCPMCGTRRYSRGYDDGSTEVCYSCRNWGPPKQECDCHHTELIDQIEALRKEVEFLRRRTNQ